MRRFEPHVTALMQHGLIAQGDATTRLRTDGQWDAETQAAYDAYVDRVSPPQAPEDVENLSENDWEILLRRIRRGTCTPFLGAGASHGVLPLGAEIARRWSRKYSYPLDDPENLSRVAQYLAVELDDAMVPKEQVVESFRKNVRPPSFDDEDEPHGVLAKLPLPVYMTTNYDDFMMQALKRYPKNPYREICRWNRFVKKEPSRLAAGYRPDPSNPLVYHLHGHSDNSRSMVLTESDYLDFLVRFSKDPPLLEPRVEEALAQTLLFIGYSLSDWSFKVLFRALVAEGLESDQRVMSVSVQLLPEEIPPHARGDARRYLDRYFRGMKVRVYWGTAQEFAGELNRRWADFQNAA